MPQTGYNEGIPALADVVDGNATSPVLDASTLTTGPDNSSPRFTIFTGTHPADPDYVVVHWPKAGGYTVGRIEPGLDYLVTTQIGRSSEPLPELVLETPDQVFEVVSAAHRASFGRELGSAGGNETSTGASRRWMKRFEAGWPSWGRVGMGSFEDSQAQAYAASADSGALTVAAFAALCAELAVQETTPSLMPFVEIVPTEGEADGADFGFAVTTPGAEDSSDPDFAQLVQDFRNASSFELAVIAEVLQIPGRTSQRLSLEELRQIMERSRTTDWEHRVWPTQDPGTGEPDADELALFLARVSAMTFAEQLATVLDASLSREREADRVALLGPDGEPIERSVERETEAFFDPLGWRYRTVGLDMLTGGATVATSHSVDVIFDPYDNQFRLAFARMATVEGGDGQSQLVREFEDDVLEFDADGHPMRNLADVRRVLMSALDELVRDLRDEEGKKLDVQLRISGEDARTLMDDLGVARWQRVPTTLPSESREDVRTADEDLPIDRVPASPVGVRSAPRTFPGLLPLEDQDHSLADRFANEMVFGANAIAQRNPETFEVAGRLPFNELPLVAIMSEAAHAALGDGWDRDGGDEWRRLTQLPVVATQGPDGETPLSLTELLRHSEEWHRTESDRVALMLGDVVDHTPFGGVMILPEPWTMTPDGRISDETREAQRQAIDASIEAVEEVAVRSAAGGEALTTPEGKADLREALSNQVEGAERIALLRGMIAIQEPATAQRWLLFNEQRAQEGLAPVSLADVVEGRAGYPERDTPEPERLERGDRADDGRVRPQRPILDPVEGAAALTRSEGVGTVRLADIVGEVPHVRDTTPVSEIDEAVDRVQLRSGATEDVETGDRTNTPVADGGAARVAPSQSPVVDSLGGPAGGGRRRASEEVASAPSEPRVELHERGREQDLADPSSAERDSGGRAATPLDDGADATTRFGHVGNNFDPATTRVGRTTARSSTGRPMIEGEVLPGAENATRDGLDVDQTPRIRLDQPNEPGREATDGRFER